MVRKEGVRNAGARNALLLAVAGSAMLGCGDSGPSVPLPPTNLSTMGVGSIRRLTMAAIDSAGGLTLPANARGAHYLMVVANVETNQTDNVPQYVVQGNLTFLGDRGRSANAAAPQSSPALRISAAMARSDLANGAYSTKFEAGLRAYERRVITPAAMRRASLTMPSGRRLTSVKAGPPAVGSKMKLNIPVTSVPNGNLCTNFDSTTATVRAVSNYAVVVSDDDSPTDGFTSDDYQRYADDFDQLIYPTDVAYFGQPTDVDGNSRIVIFFTPRVNQLTPAGEAKTKGYVGGFFFAPDLVTKDYCRESNVAEIFYVLTPDPTAQFGNAFTVADVREGTRGTVAHEFQHMINAGGRIFASGDTPLEAAWLDEGLSHFAEDVMGRQAAGFAIGQTVTLNQISSLPDSLWDAFFSSNFARAFWYVQRPDTVGPIVSDDRVESGIAARGASWLLLRYAADQYSRNSPQQFTKSLVAGPDTGSVNLSKRAGVSVDSLLGDWLVSMYTDHQGIPSLPSRFNYSSYTMRAILSALQADGVSGYLPTTTIGDGIDTVSVGVPAASAGYFLVVQPANAARTVKIGAASSVPSPTGRVYIVRMQ